MTNILTAITLSAAALAAPIASRHGIDAPEVPAPEAEFIGAGPENGAKPCMVKTEVVNEKAFTNAQWRVTGLGVFTTMVNGRMKGDCALMPGYTHFKKRKQEFTLDVTKLWNCEAGATNQLAALCTSGWWCDSLAGKNGGTRPAFRSVLELTGEDGAKQFVATDSSWLVSTNTPVVSAGIWEGESYDARIEPGDWVPATVSDEFDGEISPATGHDIVCREDLAANVMKSHDFVLKAGEKTTVDFGQNASAVPMITVKAARGTKMTIRLAEMLNDGVKGHGGDGPEGSVYLANMRGAGAKVEYVCRGPEGGKTGEWFMPFHTFYGYRYAEISADGDVTGSIHSVPVTSVSKEMEHGTIVTGDENVNRLVKNAYWGMLSNYLSIPTDCPQRTERYGWTGDTQIFAKTGAYFADIRPFMRKWMQDVRDCQEEDGTVPLVCPVGSWAAKGPKAGWSDAVVIVPWTMWKYLGDEEIVRENWEAMDRFLDRIASDGYKAKRGEWLLCDWLSFENLTVDQSKRWSDGGYTEAHLDYQNFLNAIYMYQDAMMMSDLAYKIDGVATEEQMAKYVRLAAKTKGELLSTWFTADGALDPKFDGMQTPAIYALKLELGDRAKIAKALADAVRKNGNRLSTGFLGTPYLLDELDQAGETELAYSVLLNHEFPGWLYSVDQGATTIWERWDGYTKEKGFGDVRMNSFNHYAYGAVVGWLFETAGGLKPGKDGGWKNFVIAPKPDKRLGSCRVEFDGGYGKIVSEWHFEGDELKFSYSIPEGSAATVVSPVPPLPQPAGIRVDDLKQDESPVKVETAGTEVENNGLFKRVRTSLVFTNPNKRVMGGELEMPLPEGAVVCGYSLEVNGAMVPGVVVEKEKARVAFETEKAKGVDPGIVEKAKGNIWRTRIYPLNPGKPRKAEIEWIAPVEGGGEGESKVYERDGDDMFEGVRGAAAKDGQSFGAFKKGFILWDASASASSKGAKWRGKLESLPNFGEWTLVVFRDDAETKTFTAKKDLLAAVDAVTYDGGTDIAKALSIAGDSPALFFSDELDTLGLASPDCENMPNVTIASRDTVRRDISVRKLKSGEKPPKGVAPKESKLLATKWAADRMADLASQAANRKDEFLALGRRYGVASDATSLVVLENLEQYVEHKIEPPESLSFHGEWVRRRKAEDDEIEKARNDAAHKAKLLELWEERVKWWNDPIPPKRTPSSGLFAANGSRANAAGEEGLDAAIPAMLLSAAPEAEYAVMEAGAGTASSKESGTGVIISRPIAEAGAGGATIAVKPWTADAPYVKNIEEAGDMYAAYLKERAEYGSSPAFYMDAASIFFRAGQAALGRRVISNVAELKLEDAAVWRSMGWRLREAGEYDMAVRAFEHALRLRGEEGQSRRDLATVLAERAKKTMAADPANAKRDLERAMELLKEAAFTNWARRSSRRSNDFQVSVISLEELNALVSWCEKNGAGAKVPDIEPAFRRDLPVKVRIALAWDADETDIDIHVLEPDGEEAYYGHRRTSTGGFVGEDVTTGYGPEEYLRKEGEGKFRILANYFASHQTALTGAVTATAAVYTDWGTSAEKMEIVTMRLEKPKQKVDIGEVEIR